MPDLRGYFLRGNGGNSAGLGVHQGDTLKAPNEVSGTFGWGDGGMGSNPSATGAFSFTNVKHGNNWKGSDGSYTHARTVELRLAGAWPKNFIGNETRPINKSVRYLIRARP